MQTYLLIMGGWLVVAIGTASAYARLAAFGARADAHLGEPSPASGRRRSWAFPLQVATPLAVACAAAVFLGDFSLPQQAGRSIGAIQDPQAPAVQLAQAPAVRPARSRRASERRPAAREARVVDVAPGFAPGRSAAPTSGPGAPVTPAAAPGSAIPRTGPVTRGPQRQTRPQRPGPGSSRPRPTAAPDPTPSPAPVAVTATQPPPEASPVPAVTPAASAPPSQDSEPTPPTSAKSPGKRRKPQRGNGPPPHAPAVGWRAQQRG